MSGCIEEPYSDDEKVVVVFTHPIVERRQASNTTVWDQSMSVSRIVPKDTDRVFHWVDVTTTILDQNGTTLHGSMPLEPVHGNDSMAMEVVYLDLTGRMETIDIGDIVRINAMERESHGGDLILFHKGKAFASIVIIFQFYDR